MSDTITPPRAEAHGLIDEIYDRMSDPDLQARSVERRFQLVELVIGPYLRQRMDEAIGPLDNLPADPETEHRRGLMMLGRLMYEMCPIIGTKLADVTAGDTDYLLAGTWGLLLRPVKSGPGNKSYNVVEQALIRCYVLRVYVECGNTGAAHRKWLKDQAYGPTLAQFNEWAYRRVPPEERDLAAAIGHSFRDNHGLTREQAELWGEIKDWDLADIWMFLRKLLPAT
jgi:hypothetical protein